MKDTGFSVPATKLDRLATSYSTDPETGALDALRRPRRRRSGARPPAFPSGGGGLVSTVDDYLAFGQMMLEQGHATASARILSRPSRRADDDRPADAGAEGASALAPASSTATAGASACPSSRGATTSGAIPGRFGWDGGLRHLVVVRSRARTWSAILMTQRALDLARARRDVYRDFWTSAYQAIDD